MVARRGGKKYSPAGLVKIVKDYVPYFGRNGGITVSGGEPFLQAVFLSEFLKQCRQSEIHTAVDTSLFTTPQAIDKIWPYANLFMISLKHFDEPRHRFLTGQGNQRILDNIRYLNQKNVASRRKDKPKIWFRYVVLPGETDTKENIMALISFLKTIKFELIELLPYHAYGVFKWKNLGKKYELAKIKPPSEQSVLKIKKQLENNGFQVLLNG